MNNTYNVRIEGNLDIKVLVASFGYEYEETFDHLKHAPLEYVAKYFHGGGERFTKCFINSFEDIIATLNDIDAFLKSNAEQFLGDSFTVNDACISNARIDADTITLSEGDCACSTGGAWFTLDITITSELGEYDIKNYVYETCKRLLDKFVEIGNCHRAHVSRDERFAFEITENQC